MPSISDLTDLTGRNDMDGSISETRLQAMFGQASAGIVLLDLDGCFIFVNDRFCHMVGYARAELIGRKMLDFVHPDDRARDLALFTRLIAEGIPFDIEKRYLRPDAALCWAHNSVSILRDDAGRPLSSFAISVDVTQRRTEEARLVALKDKLSGDLHATTRLYDLIFGAVDVSIYTLDHTGTITSWNPGAETIYGYPAARATGLSAEDLNTAEDRRAGVLRREMEEALREGRAVCERWKVRRDGSRFWTIGVLRPLVDDGRTVGFFKFERDATAQHAMEEARREADEERARLLVAERHARQAAEDASAAKDRFLAALSHELRTPLVPVRMALFALKREKRLSASGREMVRMIGRNLDAEVRLIDDLLDVSRIVHGKMEFKRASVDVHACIRRALEVCSGDIQAKKQRLGVDLAAGHPVLHGDADRLRQVFCNLLQNAAKFTPEGGSVGVRSFHPAPGEIAVEVTDSGMGIDAAALPDIFRAFEQGGPRIVQRFGGLGLGLAISQAVVTAHDGRLTAASAGPDRGATFTVVLPLSPSEEQN